jgi:hypothetical protein
VADRVEEVGLAEANASIEEDGVIGVAWQAARANWLEGPTTNDWNV